MPNYSPVHQFPNQTLSNSVNGLVTALEQFYDNETDFSGLPTFLQPASNQAAAALSAAITLMQWIDINKTGYTGPGLSPEDPFVVTTDQTNRKEIIENLGGDADVDTLKIKYEAVTRYQPSVRNVFFNFAPYDLGGIRWDKERNELIYFDRYNFQGLGDFGFSPPAGKMNPVQEIFYYIASGTIGLIVGGGIASPTAMVRQMMVDQGLNPNTGEFADGTPISVYGAPFTQWRTGDRQIGIMRNLFIELRIPASEICKNNPELYRDAISKGYLELNSDPAGSCSQISTQAECYTGSNLTVPVGSAQPIPLLGFPYYAPRVMEISRTSPTSWQVGSNDKYPSPFTSYIQQTYNTANYLGPYAMWGPIAGRICQIRSGSNFGDPGFIAQCWDVFDDTPNNVDGDGDRYSSKLDWWNSCEYAYVEVRNLLFTGQPPSLVKVAVKSFSGPAADDVWGPQYQPSASPFGTINLSTLIPLVALTGKYF